MSATPGSGHVDAAVFIFNAGLPVVLIILGVILAGLAVQAFINRNRFK